jgi:hypothetical protein
MRVCRRSRSAERDHLAALRAATLARLYRDDPLCAVIGDVMSGAVVLAAVNLPGVVGPLKDVQLYTS